MRREALLTMKDTKSTMTGEKFLSTFNLRALRELRGENDPAHLLYRKGT